MAKKRKMRRYIPQGLSVGMGRSRSIGLCQAGALLGAIDNFYNFGSSPFTQGPINNIANRANDAVRNLPGGDSKYARAAYLLGGSLVLKAAARASGMNPYIRYKKFKVELI